VWMSGYGDAFLCIRAGLPTFRRVDAEDRKRWPLISRVSPSITLARPVMVVAGSQAKPEKAWAA
jgi:hypothetical protein